MTALHIVSAKRPDAEDGSRGGFSIRRSRPASDQERYPEPWQWPMAAEVDIM